MPGAVRSVSSKVRLRNEFHTSLKWFCTHPLPFITSWGKVLLSSRTAIPLKGLLEQKVAVPMAIAHSYHPLFTTNLSA